LTNALVAGLVHIILIYSPHQIARRLKSSGAVQKCLHWATGIPFLDFGVRLTLPEPLPHPEQYRPIKVATLKKSSWQFQATQLSHCFPLFQKDCLVFS